MTQYYEQKLAEGGNDQFSPERFWKQEKKKERKTIVLRQCQHIQRPMIIGLGKHKIICIKGSSMRFSLWVPT
ncbi:hypothetical protein IEQ34_000790 [Dendrobium chrysotoxum]|uniref:Uncharacterized protein n=1 Tax=Dendrobium chrysotoxum TaxID=161865 RepID=A0AAV7HRF2_DENCH|nr:hypothetical protein IEQ34_000790 [Dendrobium chrysotoxum]